MVMRLRRTRKATVVALMIAIGLVGSAWLAYAAAGPTATAYPVTKAKIKAKGELNDCTTPTHGNPKCSKFVINLQRKSTGNLVGSYKLKDRVNKVNYSFTTKNFTSLTCVDNSSATFHAEGGHASGKANKGKTFDTDTTVTGSGTSGTLTTEIRDHADGVVYSYSGPITAKAKVSIACP